MIEEMTGGKIDEILSWERLQEQEKTYAS
jgi:hypothetical protein